MDLSVIVPGFRVKEWQNMYQSIKQSFSGQWEMIIVGPYSPDFSEPNLTWIEDWGCPTRCQQIGMLEAKGDWHCYGWDDGVYQNGALDRAWETLKEHNFDYKTIVIGKFVEGNAEQLKGYMPMLTEEYYFIRTHEEARSPYLPDDFKILSTGLISAKLIKEVGGFDCQFETMALSVLDLSIRLQLYGCKMIVQEGVMLICSWQPGNTGDHEPVNKAFYNADMPRYQKKYRSPDFNPDIIISKNNWQEVPRKWNRRFA